METPAVSQHSMPAMFLADVSILPNLVQVEDSVHAGMSIAVVFTITSLVLDNVELSSLFLRILVLNCVLHSKPMSHMSLNPRLEH